MNWADEQILKGCSNDLILELSINLHDKNKFLSILLSLTDSKITEVSDYYYSLYHFLLKNKLLDNISIGQEMLKLYHYSIVDQDNITHMFLSALYDYFDLKKHRLPLPFNLSTELHIFLSDYNKDIQIFKDLKFNVQGVQMQNV